MDQPTRTLADQIDRLARRHQAPESFVESIRSSFTRKGISLAEDAGPYLPILEETFARQAQVAAATTRSREGLRRLDENFRRLAEGWRRQLEQLREVKASLEEQRARIEANTRRLREQLARRPASRPGRPAPARRASRPAGPSRGPARVPRSFLPPGSFPVPGPDDPS